MAISPERAAKEAATVLMSAFKLTVPDDPPRQVFAQAYRVATADSGKRYVVIPQALTSIKQTVQRLLPLLDHYPVEECERTLTAFVVQEKDAGTSLPQVHDRLRQSILQFLQGLTASKEWELVQAVRHIDPTQDAFSVGACTFYLMGPSEFLLWGRRMSSGKYNPPANTPVLPEWTHGEAALQGQFVAAARVRAADRQHATRKGLRRIEEALNLLRYGQLVVGFPSGDVPEVGYWNRHWQHDHNVVICLEQPKFSTNVSIGGPEGNLHTQSSRAPGWSAFEQMVGLDLSMRTELQIRMTTFLEWCGLAARAPSASVRLVAVVTALEALLISESEAMGKKSKLMRRVASLAAKSDAEIQEIEAQVDELYRARSACVHGGVTDVERRVVDQAVELMAKAVDALTSRPPFCTYSTLVEVLQQLDPRQTLGDSSRTKWIAENAYCRWIEEGCPNGRDVQHWLDAEREYACNALLRGRPIDSIVAVGGLGDD